MRPVLAAAAGRMLPAAALAFVAALVCLASAATAADKYWTDGSGQWDVAGNWNPSGQPHHGDKVYLTQSDSTDRTVTYYSDIGPELFLSSLTIDATGTGTITLDMPNAHVLSGGTEYVGYEGKGAVTQSAGGHGAYELYLGYSAAGEGTYTMTGGWLTPRDLFVGYEGTGTLSIEAGGKAHSDTAYLGYSSGSTGTATVTGAGSTWTNNDPYGDLVVGYGGSGTLNVEAGGEVISVTAYLGYSSGGTGTATVTGDGSTWTNSGDLFVSYNGSGTLTVSDGGVVSTGTLYASLSGLSGNGTIAARGAVLDTALVFDGTHGLTQALAFGAGGTLNLSVGGTSVLGAGYKGTGTLRIADGLAVASTLGYLGYWSGSTGTATVTGDGSTWTNAGNLYVGYNGSGTLNIEAGGQVGNTRAYLGYSSGSTGIATVTGDGSTWTNSSNLYVGYEGTGTLNIEAGGQVSSSGCNLGDGLGSTGTVTVTGDGSTWTNSGNLYVGYEGGGTLNIEAGGQVSGAYGLIGYRSGSTGTATVTGDGSTWTNSGNLSVGGEGTGTLTVTSGGRVTARTLWASRSDLLGDGTITAQGAVLDADLVFDGTHGLAQALAFGAGGTLNLNVDGTGVLGAGYHASGTLRIADGRTVASTSGYLGYWSGSTGTATVTGDGSMWTSSGILYVGNKGTGTLNIENGGQVSNTSGRLGSSSGSAGTATVTGAGSTWTNSSDLCVGSSGNGTLNIEAGGQVGNANGCLGCNSGSTGTATVTGEDSTWTNSGTLYVGEEGAGTLNIGAGGEVNNTVGYLASSSGSTGTVTVDGTGAVWNNTNSLYLGGKSNTATGGMGSITVRSGGRLAVGETLRLWRPDSAVTVSEGTLSCGVLACTSGTIRITDPADGTAFTVGSAASGTFSVVLRDDTGPGSLIKIGAGTQTLSGSGITYTGATTVLAGKLKLSNATAFASGILNSAATEFAVSSGTWTFDEAIGGAGAFTKSGAGTLVIAGPQDYAPGALFDVLGGAAVLNTDASGTGLMTDAHLAISVTGAELRFGANQHLDTLTVGTGGKVVFAGADRAALKHLANTGTIDLATAALVVDYDGSSPLADVRAMLASGCAGGLWNGPGIQSSAAAADPDDLTALGVLDNADPQVGGKTTFEGEAVDATAVLVKYTWAGDANLDGVVDANDYDVIDKMFLFPPVPDSTGWWTGDFTYDGVIDANDYDRIDRAFLFQTGPLAGGMPASTPEPATLALVGAGLGAALLFRRKAEPSRRLRSGQVPDRDGIQLPSERIPAICLEC